MAGVLRYEWRRISSIRSTWILLGASILVSAGLAALLSLAFSAANSASSSDSALAPLGKLPLAQGVGEATTNFIILVLLGTVAAQAFGQEYRHGTIRLTLTAFPRRLQVFTGKILVCCFWITIAFLISAAAAALVLLPQSTVVEAPNDALSFAAFLLRAWLYLMGFCLVVFACTVLTRILALGVIIPLLLALVVENLLASIVGNWITWIPKVLPFSSGSAFMNGDEMLRNGLVFLAWVAVVTVAALFVFERRDA